MQTFFPLVFFLAICTLISALIHGALLAVALGLSMGLLALLVSWIFPP